MTEPVPTPTQRLAFPQHKALRWVSLVTLVLFAWVGWESLGFPASMDEAEVGPARLPFITAIAGALTSLGLFAGTFASATKSNTTAYFEIRHPGAILLAAVAISGWVVLMPYVGFYLVSAVAVPVIMLTGGERRLSWLVLSTIGFWLFVYFVFEVLLGIEFP